MLTIDVMLDVKLVEVIVFTLFQEIIQIADRSVIAPSAFIYQAGQWT